jgi:hypothetical protein
MTPDEVVEAILTWDRVRTAAGDTPAAQYFSGLASLLADIIARASELEVRDYGEGLDTTRYHLGAKARALRGVTAEAPAECRNTVEPLRAITVHLDNAAHQELMMGSGWTEMAEAAEAALAGAKAFVDRYLKPEFFSAETITILEGTIATVAGRQNAIILPEQPAQR